MPATKDEVLAETTTAWAEYSARLATVTDEDLCRLNSGHGWTLKDVVSHIAVWEREAVHVIQALVEGREIHDYADFDPWNERFYNEHKDTPIDQVRTEAFAAHRALVTMLQELPPGAFDEQVVEWAIGSGAGHLREHISGFPA